MTATSSRRGCRRLPLALKTRHAPAQTPVVLHSSRPASGPTIVARSASSARTKSYNPAITYSRPRLPTHQVCRPRCCHHEIPTGPAIPRQPGRRRTRGFAGCAVVAPSGGRLEHGPAGHRSAGRIASSSWLCRRRAWLSMMAVVMWRSPCAQARRVNRGGGRSGPLRAEASGQSPAGATALAHTPPTPWASWPKSSARNDIGARQTCLRSANA